MEADGSASGGGPRAPSDSSAATSAQFASSESGRHEHASLSPGPSESAAPAHLQASNGQESAQVTVHVKFIHHESVALQCAPTIPIAELRRKVLEVEHARAGGSAEDEGNPPRLRLIYKGKVLKDDKTLDAYNFQHEDTIHAIVSRPNVPPPPEPPAQERATARPVAESISGEEDGRGNGFVMAHVNTGTDMTSADLGSILTSMISGAVVGAVRGGRDVTMGVSFGQGTTPGSSVTAAATRAPTTSVAATTTTSASLPTTSASTPTSANYSTTSAPSTTSASYSTTSSSGTSTTTPVMAYSGVSPARAHFLAQAAAASSQRATSAATLQDQASAVRRMMPPIDLGPMTRPPELSEEMYELGNTVREASDTFMALHRQLAHLSGRLLNENNLSPIERARLRMQIQRLGPVLRGASDLATSLDRLLAESSVGWPTRSTPATPSNAGGPPPGPASAAGGPPSRPEPSSDTGAGPAGSRSATGDNLQRGGNGTRPRHSDLFDDDPHMAQLASNYYEARQRAIDVLGEGAAQTQANEPAGRPPSASTSSYLPPEVPALSDSNRPPFSALDYLQRLSESTRSSTTGMGALGSILTETGNLLSQLQSSEGPSSAPPSAPPTSANRATRDVPVDLFSTARGGMEASLRSGSRLSSPPIISTTPISDLIFATMSRCVGTLETDISEFYHISSDIMRSMFPFSLPDSEIQERRKEWRMRAMNEIETKASYCCDEELVCRDELLSPAMDDALDAFIRECLAASFLTSGEPADSAASPIHNAWVKIWANVRSWVNRQPTSTGRLILSRILVEEVRDAAVHLDQQERVRRLYDRTMACAVDAPDAEQA